MVVGLRLKLEHGDRGVVTVVLLNSGYEALRPEMPLEEYRIAGPVEADAVLSEEAEEPLISDKLASKLGMAL